MLPTTNLVRLRHLLGEVYAHNSIIETELSLFFKLKSCGVPVTADTYLITIL